LVGFVNDLPVVVTELKKPAVPARAALERLNPALPPEAITAVVDELTHNLLLPRLLSGQVALRDRIGLC
jgi:type I site-specific restriction-modification system R (restriction) subunit